MGRAYPPEAEHGAIDIGRIAYVPQGEPVGRPFCPKKRTVQIYRGRNEDETKLENTRIWKRLASGLLTAAMLVTMLPTTAFFCPCGKTAASTTRRS